MRRNKKAHQVRASAVNALSARLGTSVTVLATAALALPENLELASFGCKHCGTQFNAQASISPFCVTCGSDDVAPEVDDTPKEELNEDDELAGILCAGCGTHNIMSDAVAAKLGGNMFCVTCGDGLTYTPPETDELPEVNPVAGTDDGDDDEDDGPAGELPLVNGDEPTATAGEGDEPHAEPDGDEGETPTVPADGDGDEGEAATAIKPAPSDEEEIRPPQDADVTGTDSRPAEVEDEIDVPMTDLAKPDDEFDVLLDDDDKVVAMFGGVPAAVLTRESATAAGHGDVWGKVALTRAITASVERDGVSALAQFGFAPIVAKFPMAKIVEARVSAVLADKAKELESAVAALQSDWKQSLVIAAAGHNKGFFADKTNELKAALYNEMSAMGVKSPAKVIDRVFKAHGAPYLASLLEIAGDLLQKNVEVRNQISDAVEASTYLEAEEGEDGEDGEGVQEGEEVSARFATHQGARVTAKATPVSASYQPGSLRGRKLFGTS